MAGRFLSQRDINTFEKFNRELLGDLDASKDGIVNQKVTVYKISVQDTKVNMYGESSAGKIYKPGVQIACLIEAEEVDFNTDEFGPDLRQNGIFRFLRQSLIDISLVVELGDIVDWNYAHWEIASIGENQLIGGQFDQNWAVICSAHLIRKSALNIEQIRSI